MNDYFDCLERAVVDSANRRAHVPWYATRLSVPAGRASRRLGTVVRALAIVAVIGFTVAVAVVVQSSLQQGRAVRHPVGVVPSGPFSTGRAEPPRGWFMYFGLAQHEVFVSDPSCANTPPPATPIVDHERPASSITTAFPLLGEPATGTHRVSIAQLKRFNFLGGLVAAGRVYIRYAWQGRRDGVHYYELPAAALGLWPPPPPARCDREVLTAFRHEVRNLPAAAKREEIAFMVSRQRTQAATYRQRKPYHGICAIYLLPDAHPDPPNDTRGVFWRR